MKKIATTLLTNWERIPQAKKENLLEQMREMSVYILNMQQEEYALNPDPVIEEKYKSGAKRKPGLIGELIPAHLVKDADLMQDLETTFALLNYCK